MNKEPERLRLVVMSDEAEELERRRRGFWLRMAREDAGHTQAAAAELIGYKSKSKSSINAWEDGRRPVPVNQLKALARLYDVPVELFIDPQPTAHEEVRRLRALAHGAIGLATQDEDEAGKQDPDADEPPDAPRRRRSA